jgi:hypothetical protein
MVCDEAPAATFGGVNGNNDCDRTEIGSAPKRRFDFEERSDQPRCCGNPSWTKASGHLRRLAALQHTNCVPSPCHENTQQNQRIKIGGSEFARARRR